MLVIFREWNESVFICIYKNIKVLYIYMLLDKIIIYFNNMIFYNVYNI